MHQLDYYTFLFFVGVLPIISKKSKSGRVKIICLVAFLLFCIYEISLMLLSFFKMIIYFAGVFIRYDNLKCNGLYP